MAVDALQIVGGLALKLYEVVESVSANRTQCGVISDRVGRIMTEVERLDPKKHETLVEKGGFANFQSTLESAVDLCSEFVDKSNFRRWFACKSDGEKFDTIRVRLDEATQDLQLDIGFELLTWQQAQQTDTSTMLDFLGGLVHGQHEQKSLLVTIIDELAAVKLNFQQGTSNATTSSTNSPPWSLNPNQVKFDRVKDEDEDELVRKDPLGQGSFGTVYQGVFQKKPVAIKSVTFDTTKAQESFVKEVNILFMLHHPNITTFHGAVLKPKKGDMVLELFDRSLADALHIRGSAKLTSDEKLAIIKDITSAMQYLHSTNPKIIHSDLKPGNVMITKKGVAKLIDFGLSATKTSSRSSRTKVGTGGTTPYQPPELHQPPRVGDHTVDIYAFGITVNEIFAEEVPFADVPAVQIADEICKGVRPPIAPTLPLHLRQIVDGCLQTNPASRPEFVVISIHLYQHSNRNPLLTPSHNSSGRSKSGKPPPTLKARAPSHNSSGRPKSGKPPPTSKARAVQQSTRRQITPPPSASRAVSDEGIYSTPDQETKPDMCTYSSARGDCSHKRKDKTSLFCRFHRCPHQGCSSSKSSTVKWCQLHFEHKRMTQLEHTRIVRLKQLNQRAHTGVKSQQETASTPSWILEGGADGAIRNFTLVFKEAPETFVDRHRDWELNRKCDTVEKQKAVARVLATNATVTGWNGSLYLEENKIGDEGANHIGEGVKHSTSLKKLVLNQNKIGAKGAEYISEGVKHSKSLQKLYLSSNKIGAAGAKHIGEGVKHSTSLQDLAVHANDIGDEGAKHLGEGIDFSTMINVLHLGKNKIGAEGAKYIGQVVKYSTSLQILDLSYNNIGDEGANYIGEGVMYCTSLQELHISSNNFSDEAISKLTQACSDVKEVSV